MKHFKKISKQMFATFVFVVPMIIIKLWIGTTATVIILIAFAIIIAWISVMVAKR